MKITAVFTSEEISLIRKLAQLAKREHYYCYDTWYSCPKEPNEGCANDEIGDECNCGADDHNAEVARILQLLHIEWTEPEKT